MKNPKPEFSEYKGMWLFVLFDLPVESKSQRRQYARFRVALLKLGFTMLQYSVYARYCPSEEIDQSYRKKVKEVIPPEKWKSSSEKNENPQKTHPLNCHFFEP